ncbi:hypothetical protein [Microbacterium sp. NPDC056234]|uniref:hypothetical protein n=1 Tax=Microbacterium sp. NPDC056234 TaxID=3345757 RepID=UPI0035D8858C
MSALEILRLVLLVVHIVGTSAIVGAFILQMPWRKSFDFSPMLVGSIVQIVSGCALIAVRKFDGLEVVESKMIVKLAIAVVILAIVIVAMVRQRALRNRESSDAGLRGLLYAIGVLAIGDVIVALAWH